MKRSFKNLPKDFLTEKYLSFPKQWNLLLSTIKTFFAMHYGWILFRTKWFCIISKILWHITFLLSWIIKFLWTWFWSSLKMILNWCTTRDCHWYVFNFPFQGSCTWLCRRESRLKLLKFWSEYSTTCHFWWKHNSTKWGFIARYCRDDCEQWTYWEVISLLLHQEIYFQDHGNIFPRT